MASSNIKTTINSISRPLLRTPPIPDKIEDVNDIAAPGSKRSIIADPENWNPNPFKNVKKLLADLLIKILSWGRFSEKSFSEVQVKK